MTRRYIVIAIALAVAAVAVIWKRNAARVAAIPEPLAQFFSPGALPGFTLGGIDPRSDSKLYTLTNGPQIAHVEVLEHIEADDASTLMKDGMMGIHALYANALSPYPGDISNKLTSDPAYAPRMFQETNLYPSIYFLLYANDRLGYGPMGKDSVKYKSLVGWFHCGATREFFKVRLFAPVVTDDAELQRLFRSLRCR